MQNGKWQMQNADREARRVFIMHLPLCIMHSPLGIGVDYATQLI
jgi:hypothetical protein